MEAYKDFNLIRLQKVFTFLIILFPIIGLYGTPLPGVTIADLLLIALYPFLFMKMLILDRPVTKSFALPLIIYLIYVTIQLLIILPSVQSASLFDLTMSSIRYILYLITLVIFIKTFFDYDYGIRLLKYVTVIASIYLIVQYLAYYLTGAYLPGNLPFLKFMSTSIDNLTYLYEQGYEIRVSSFFAEPAHFSTYVILFLLFDLMLPKKKLTEYLVPMIISIAILFSRSSTGILMCILIWMIWFLIKLAYKENMSGKLKFLIGILILLPVISLLLVNSEAFQVFMNRTYSDGHLGSAALGRVGNVNFREFVETSTPLQILIGKGLDDSVAYLPGLARLVYCYGIIGFTMFLTMIALIFLRADKKQRILIFVFLILNIGTEMLFGYFILLYFSFLFVMNPGNSKRERISNKPVVGTEL